MEPKLYEYLTGRDKPFFIDRFRRLLNAFDKEEISMSKFVEELNIIAYEWSEKQSIDFAEWMDNNATKIEKSLWCHQQEGKDHPLTSKELYNLFQQQKLKK